MNGVSAEGAIHSSKLIRAFSANRQIHRSPGTLPQARNDAAPLARKDTDDDANSIRRVLKVVPATGRIAYPM
jgi:hypothetical protein